MTSSAELMAWLRPMGLLAVEVASLIAAGALLQRVVRTAAGRRALWQACVLGVLALVCAEVSGTGRALTASLARSSPARSQTPHPVPPIFNCPSPTDPARGAGEVLPAPPGRSDSAAAGTAAAEPLTLRGEFRQRVAERVVANRDLEPQANAGSEAARPPGSSGRASIASGAIEFPDLVWIGWIWILGTGLFLLRAVTARLLSAWFRFRSPPVTETRLADAASRLARRLGWKRSLSLKESAGLRGPVAFGVVRPTIILPAGFADQFSPAQQDAMLSHEIAHLAARDPFWQFVADLTAALLWWHPLVWWARRRLHMANEAAADLASAVLSDGPRVLAECLVRLGDRLTQREALGWLGVTGFRSQLGRRVEHLLSLERPSWRPRDRWRASVAKACGTLAAVALILLGTAWALPLSLTQGDNMKTIRQSWKQSLAAFALLAGTVGQDLAAESAEPASPPAPVAPTPPPAAQNPAPEEPAPPAMDRRLMERYGIRPAQNAPSDREMNVRRMMERRYGLSPRGGSPALERKLEEIRFDEVQFDGLPLPEVLKFLSEKSRQRDPEKKGVNFLINPNTLAPAPPQVIDPATGVPVPAPAPEATDMGAVIVKFNLPLHDVRLRDVLDAIVKVADRPIHYTVEDYAVVFSQNPEASPPSPAVVVPSPAASPLMVRTFRVDTNKFEAGLERAFGIKLEPGTPPSDTARPRQMQSALRQLLTQLGIAMDVAGKAVFYNDLTGVVMVRGTPEDLEIVRAAVETLGGSPNEAEAAAPPPMMSQEMMRRYGLSPARR